MKKHSRFFEWMKSASPEERSLRVLALELEDKYFDDVRLETARIKKRLFRIGIEDDDGQMESYDEDPPHISVNNWIFKYRSFRGDVLGMCDLRRETIYVKPGRGEQAERRTILHEILHAYEHKLPPAFLQWLTIDLYQRISKRIPASRLNRFIDISTHAVFHNSSHGVFFLLKSLDLDHRHSWAWGTTFNYGRDELFAFRRTSESTDAVVE